LAPAGALFDHLKKPTRRIERGIQRRRTRSLRLCRTPTIETAPRQEHFINTRVQPEDQPHGCP
jgi:hypothetical protein